MYFDQFKRKALKICDALGPLIFQSGYIVNAWLVGQDLTRAQIYPTFDFRTNPYYMFRVLTFHESYL